MSGLYSLRMQDGVFLTVGWPLLPEVREMVVKGRKTVCGFKSLRTDFRGGGMCVKTRCMSEQVVWEKRGVTGNLLCCASPHTLVQSSLSTLFRFSWVCFAFLSPSLILLLFARARRRFCVFIVYYFARDILTLYVHGSSTGPVPSSLLYVTFLWAPKENLLPKHISPRPWMQWKDRKTNTKKKERKRENSATRYGDSQRRLDKLRTGWIWLKKQLQWRVARTCFTLKYSHLNVKLRMKTM